MKKVLQYITLSLAAFIIIAPLLYALLISFETAADSVAFPPKLIPSELYVASYAKALQMAPVFQFIINSFIIASAVTLGQLITCSLAAYAFAFFEFPGKNLLFYLFLSTMMIPWEATIIPNYFTIRAFDWLDTYQGLAVPFLASAFGTFLLRQAFLSLPKEIFEAALIDGCGKFRFFVTMVLPLSRPALSTLSVYAFLAAYNQYMWPLLVTNTDVMRTVQIGLAMLQWDQAIAWNTSMAGVILVSLPTVVLLVVGQKQLVRGLTAGTTKG
jgi:ABC-type glycerol-3-phosphate transport system permease component